jgi:hypothetical protein
MSPTRQCPFQVRTTFDCLIVFIVPVPPLADENLSASLRGVWRAHTEAFYGQSPILHGCFHGNPSRFIAANNAVLFKVHAAERRVSAAL